MDRVSFTTIDCSSPSDAARLANSLNAAWTGGGPKPDLIEANGAQVALTWSSLKVAAPFSAVRTATSGVNLGGVTVKHSDGSTTSTKSD